MPMLSQGELFDIESPCINICKWNNRGYCLGCFRSRDERFHWLKFSDFQRQKIINLCDKRKSKVNNNKLKRQLQSELDTVQLDFFEPPLESKNESERPSIYIDNNIQPPLF